MGRLEGYSGQEIVPGFQRGVADASQKAIHGSGFCLIWLIASMTPQEFVPYSLPI